MKFQQLKASCGPASLSAALEAVGITRTEAELAHLAGTDSDGTEWEGLLDALEVVKNGVANFQVEGKAFEDTREYAVMRLLRALDAGHAVVCCVSVDSPWDHYLAVVGSLGTYPDIRVLVFDPAATEAFQSMPIQQFIALWKGPPKVKRPYAGIVV